MYNPEHVEWFTNQNIQLIDCVVQLNISKLCLLINTSCVLFVQINVKTASHQELVIGIFFYFIIRDISRY
jgi:hypothetical protein